MKKETVTCRICGGKNVLPVLKRRNMEEELYSQYCPNPELLEEREVDRVLQSCSHCGYVFPRIDEDTKVERKVLNTKEYRFPFTENYRGSAAALQCYQVSLIYREMECYRLSAKWAIYAAVLLGNDHEKERTQCFRKAFLRLRRCKTFEEELAKLNILRLVGMHVRAIEVGSEMLKQCEGVDKQLVKSIIWLAKHRNAEYMTYFDMLSLQIQEE